MLFLKVLLIFLLTTPAFAYNPRAKAVSNTPAGNITSTNVQGAINEIDSHISSGSHIPQSASFNILKPYYVYSTVGGNVILWVKTPYALTITSIYCSSDAAPSPEYTAYLSYADDFIGLSGQTNIHYISTSSGKFSVTSGISSPNVPAGKDIYLQLSGVPDSSSAQFSCSFGFYFN